MKSILFLLSIIVLIFVYKTVEEFKVCDSNSIPVSHLSAKECGNSQECGWCANKYNYGYCVKGNKNGPYIHNCDSWWHLNKCIYGPQCNYSLYYYNVRQNPYH